MTTSPTRVHAFGDDALGDLDAVGVADSLARGSISAREAVEAALARADAVDQHLGGFVVRDDERALTAADAGSHVGVFAGVPTAIKDNTDVAGLPTQHGSRAWTASPAAADEDFTTQYRSTGGIVLGKTAVPEFGFNASTEFDTGSAVHNPWHTGHSAGGSSGGSAALVAAGVLPYAHANDGGGSIRIPAASCGLVGLKLTRGREVIGVAAKSLPVNIISNGVVTRSVRDTAAFVAQIERFRGVPNLPRIGHVTSASTRRLRIAVLLDSLVPEPTDAETRAAVERVASVLKGLGHEVEPAAGLPVGPDFPDHFAHYWSLLAFSLQRFGSRLMDPSFDRTATDPLTQGLARSFLRSAWRAPVTIAALRRTTKTYRESFSDIDLIVSPVLTHTTPPLGHLSPTQGFDSLFPRLVQYAGFTPVNNASGGPAISLPLAQTATGLPIGVQLAADHGDERTLLEVAYELEEAMGFARITDAVT